MQNAATINLVRGRGEPFVDRFLKWALTGGRVVIVITESVALLAFLYRFTLDQQIVDLHTKIQQEQAIMALLAKNEKTYRDVQDRISLSNQFGKSAMQTVSVFSDVTKLIPTDMSMKTFSLSSSSIKLEGSTPSILSLSSFIDSLKKYQGIQSVSVDKIENRTTTATIAFGITATLKGAPVTGFGQK